MKSTEFLEQMAQEGENVKNVDLLGTAYTGRICAAVYRGDKKCGSDSHVVYKAAVALCYGGFLIGGSADCARERNLAAVGME